MELIDSMEEGPNKTANISMFFDERIETVHAVRRFIITCFLVCKGIWRASSSQAKLVQQTSSVTTQRMFLMWRALTMLGALSL